MDAHHAESSNHRVTDDEGAEASLMKVLPNIESRRKDKEPPTAAVQAEVRSDCRRMTWRGETALQEFFNFLLLSNSSLVRSLNNILHRTSSDQLVLWDRCRETSSDPCCCCSLASWGGGRCGVRPLRHTWDAPQQSSGGVAARQDKCFYSFLVGE